MTTDEISMKMTYSDGPQIHPHDAPLTHVVVTFGAGPAEGWCTLSHCPMEAHGPYTEGGAQVMCESLPEWMQPHILRLADPTDGYQQPTEGLANHDGYRQGDLRGELGGLEEFDGTCWRAVEDPPVKQQADGGKDGRCSATETGSTVSRRSSWSTG